jgi:hypothetical protein
LKIFIRFTIAVLASFLVLLSCTLLPDIQAATRKTIRPNTCKFDIGYNVNFVADQARALSSHSWEYGTTAEAFLELYNPSLSIFGPDPFPGGQIPYVDWTEVKALSYAKPFILINSETLIDGDGKPILEIILF